MIKLKNKDRKMKTKKEEVGYYTFSIPLTEKKIKIQKKEIGYYIFSVPLIVFVVYLVVGGVLKQTSVSRNAEETYAIITEFRSGPRGSYYLSYRYFANGTEHQGGGRHYPKNDNFSIGDTIIIFYDARRPANSRPKRDGWW